MKKNNALRAIADILIKNKEEIISANKLDIGSAEQNGVRPAMVDRLMLDGDRIDGIASALDELCGLADPIGTGDRWNRPNGLEISRVRVPLGVIAIIYEARPNVTVDAAALCLKTGNAVVLRGGKEAINTNRILVKLMREAIESAGICGDAVQLVDDTSREGTNELLCMRGYIDALIPRGGKGLIRSVVENARVPVIEQVQETATFMLMRAQISTWLSILPLTPRPHVLLYAMLSRRFLFTVMLPGNFSLVLRKQQRRFMLSFAETRNAAAL